MDCRQILNSGEEEQMRCSSLFDNLAIDILEQGSYLRFRAHGNSMAPLIQNGDTIIIEPKKINELYLGSIVFYRRGAGRYVVHRIAGKVSNNGTLLLKTKGDNLRHSDPPVCAEQVLGKVVFIEARGKKLPIDNIFGRVMNLLMLYANVCNSYKSGFMRRVLARIWWLASVKLSR